MINHRTNLILFVLTIVTLPFTVKSQCTFEDFYYESFEYTTPIPGLDPAKVYHNTPQTNSMANTAKTGQYGMYMNIRDGETGVLYRNTIPDLCVGNTYEFSFSYRNATSTLPHPNFRISVLDDAANVIQTTDLTAANTWRTHTFPSYTAPSASVIIQIETLIPGGPGNDLGIDDITLKRCISSKQNKTLSLCTSGNQQDLYGLINSPVISPAGTWEGPGALTNGHLGTFDPTTQPAGDYHYYTGSSLSCADSIATIRVTIIPQPSIDPISDVTICNSYTLPVFSGTNLAANNIYYTSSGGTGTSYLPGSIITASQVLYAYSGTASCHDEKMFRVTIETNDFAGSDRTVSYCSAGTTVTLSSLLTGNTGTSGTWAESTQPPSGQFTPSTSVFNTNNLSPGSYTFTYSVAPRGSCPASTASFTINIGNLQSVNLGPDTTLCAGQSILLSANTGTSGSSYLWNNGSTNSTRLVTSPGTYSVKVTNIGDNLIHNGDFESGNTGFTTDYAVGTGGTYGQLSNPGTYAISSSPSMVHNNFSYCNDHTPGAGTQMMIVNGAATPGTKVWCQNVSIQPYTDYQFSTWVSNALNERNVAQLQFSINNIDIGNPFQTSTTACNWQQFFQVWNSGSSASANICIVNQNIVDGGNDFMLDDITFSPVCVSQDTIVVSYHAAFNTNLGPDINVCEDEMIVLDAGNPGMSYLWNDNSANQTLSVNQSGRYFVTVSYNGRCPKSDTVNVTFHAHPDAGRDSSLTVCNSHAPFDLVSMLSVPSSPNSHWYNMNTQAVISSSVVNPASMDPASSFQYIAESQYCPSDTVMLSVVVNVQHSAGTDHILSQCNTGGLTLDLNTLLSGTTSSGAWSEQTSSNQFDTTNGIFDLSGLSAGNYLFHYVVDSDIPCLQDTSLFTIRVVETPIIQFSSDVQEGCSPLTISFSNESYTSAQSSYFWDFGNGVTSNDINPSQLVFSTPQCYDVTLTVTAENLCTASGTQTAMFCVHPNPIAEFEYNPVQIFSDDPVVNFENTSQLNAQNIWDFGDGENSNQLSPTHKYPDGEGGNYLVQLIVISEHGCRDTTSRIIIVNEQIIFHVPNAFTPNGDELNNQFLPVMYAGIDVTSYSLEIYNRWGEKVFRSYDVSVGWDGTYNGVIAQSGTYVWKITFSSAFDSERFERTGHVTLIR